MISWTLRRSIPLWCVDAYMNHKIVVHISVQVPCTVTHAFCAQDFDTSAPSALVNTIKFYPRRYIGNIYILTYKFISLWHVHIKGPISFLISFHSCLMKKINRIRPFPSIEFTAVRVLCPDTRAYCLLCLTVIILTCPHFRPVGCQEGQSFREC